MLKIISWNRLVFKITLLLWSLDYIPVLLIILLQLLKLVLHTVKCILSTPKECKLLEGKQSN